MAACKLRAGDTFLPAMRACAGLLVAVLLSGRAVASPASCPSPRSATVEVAPWVAVGGGVRHEGDRTVGIGHLALDTGVTFPLHELVRGGAWVAGGTVDFRAFDVGGGARLELLTSELDGSHSGLFGVTGRYALVVDGGFGTRLEGEPSFVARLSAGFVAPNRLYHLYQFDCACEDAPCRPDRGLVSGARPFVALNRSLSGTRTEITFGIEFEAIGAGWWFGSL